FAGFVGYFSSYRRREQLRLVDDHQHRIPVITRNLEKTAQESRGTPHLVFGVEPLEIQDSRNAMDAHALARDLQCALRVLLRVDDKVIELFGKRDEIAFGIDDCLLYPGDALLEKPPQQMGFSGAGIALHQEARRKQFLEVQRGRVTRCGASDLDSN